MPLYIGDWEKDCNVLSLESEAAWLRIIFKMFTNGKQSSYKLPTKGLQNLWRVSEEKVHEILQELQDYDICEIHTEGRFTEFTSRRYEKENQISEIRKEAVSKRKDRNKNLQNPYKKSTKEVQITDNDNDNDIDNDNNNEIEKEEKKGVGKKEEKTEVVFPFDSENFKTQWQHWKVYKRKEFKFNFKSLQSEQASLTELANKSNGNEKIAIAIIHQSMANGWKGFFELKNKSSYEKQIKQNGPSDEFRRKTAERLGII